MRIGARQEFERKMHFVCVGYIPCKCVSPVFRRGGSTLEHGLLDEEFETQMLNSHRDPVDPTAQQAAGAEDAQDQVLAAATMSIVHMSQHPQSATSSISPDTLGEAAVGSAECDHADRPPGQSLVAPSPAAPATGDQRSVPTRPIWRRTKVDIRLVSGGVMTIVVFTEMIVGGWWPDDTMDWTLAGGATAFAVPTGWRMLKAVWRKYGPARFWIYYEKTG